MTRLSGRTSVRSTCRYDIDQNCLLGKGAFGIVYKGKIVKRGNFNSTETTVAVKVTYWEQGTKSQSRVEDWLELIERWKRLFNFRPHAHLISYHKLSFNVASGGFVGFEFLMDYCDGGDLATVLSKPNCKEPSQREASKLVNELTVACHTMQIAAGLEYLHKNQFVHMDLKPHNILVKIQRTGHHRLVIADLDDIIQMREAQTHSCDFPPNNVRGTLRYMSPEMLKTFANMPSLEKAGQNTDVWSLGCVMQDLIDYCYGIEERTLRKTTTEFPCNDVIMDNTTKDFQYMKLIDKVICR
ncbi:serine/threonine-protein kinase nekl-2-like [Paramacrobiotus metropolitanus]|uniref:serine/threonine-protein kinase nekl-2-like n=1 Tax=Paramacrobiotus metropolitanus TaxID=2943436 RepID=UPI002445C734|nr:serine/threonine-protein kinase nekl-2-like [Paramacrobiotus metropolitanus]